MTDHSFSQYDPDQGAHYRLMPCSAHMQKIHHTSPLQLPYMLIKAVTADRKHDDFASHPDINQTNVVRLIPKARYFTP